jgi:hypothetical protein
MGLNHALATATLDDRAQRAALRDGVLECGRLIGWATRTTIVFAERLARRPWNRCTRVELSAVFGELRSILRAYELRRRTPPARPCAARADRARRARRANARRNGYAPRG